MRKRRMIQGLAGLALLASAGTAAFLMRDQWTAWLDSRSAAAATAEKPAAPLSEAKVLKLSSQARKNLGLVSKPVTLQTYWRTIQVPGVIVDRPGISDRGVSAPAVGAVVQIHAFPGDTVRPGEALYTLRVFSEYLQNTQSELFKATRETQLGKEKHARLEKAAKSGAIPEATLIEVDNQLRREMAVIQAYRQDLLTRGLSPQQIDRVAEGDFVSTITVVAPPPAPIAKQQSDIQPVTFGLVADDNGDNHEEGLAYEVQELKAELGQQVQAGQLLCVLANHQSLYLEGHAFKQEAPLLERAATRNWDVRVEFADDDSQYWPSQKQEFEITYLANAVDPATRTLDFRIPLSNQSRTFEKEGHTHLVWRYRPGQRVRLHVPVEELKGVIVLPSAAVVREGPEAYVFRQNGDLFDRRPVHVLHENRLNIVLANDGSVTPGLYLAQNAAASLNRVLKAQAASGMRADIHVHADGTTHAAH